MASATAMYYSGRNPLRKIHRTVESDDENVDVVRGEKRRRLHKAFLRYHDPNNWPLLREALKAMGRADLVGNGKHHLIPTYQPLGDGGYQSARKKNSTPLSPDPRLNVPAAKTKPLFAASKPVKGHVLTQHTGLPPRETGAPRTPAKGLRKGSR
jgi:hypothetical protein